MDYLAPHTKSLQSDLFVDLNFNESLRHENLINKQIQLLNDCIVNGKNLASMLKAYEMKYDDLRYIKNNKPYILNKKFFSLTDFREAENQIPVISFFSGAGGLDLGFEASGFSHKLLIEKIPLFRETIKRNRPEWKVILADISITEMLIELIASEIDRSPFEGVFIGGPPCQPFSIASNQRFNKNGDNFKRVGFAHETNGNLLFDYIQLIKHFKPRAFLIENVPGLMEIDGGEQIQNAYQMLEESGYTLNKPLVLRADYYYVPQQRTRLFIIGNRVGKCFNPPQPSLSSLAVGATFALNVDQLENHITREHTAESIFRYMQLDYGKRDKLGRVDRLDPHQPSKTVIAGGTKGGGRSHLHPYIPRTLSVRESARIQTFPDDYIFAGPVARQFTQVGNAVPPILAAQIANAMKKSFFY